MNLKIYQLVQEFLRKMKNWKSEMSTIKWRKNFLSINKEIEIKFSMSKMKNFTFKRTLPEDSFDVKNNSDSFPNFLPKIDHTKYKPGIIDYSLKVSKSDILPKFSRTTRIKK